MWRRDALRRLLVAQFGSKDEDEILELLKAEQKLSETTLKAEPLLLEHIPAPGTGSAQITLLSLSNVTGANNLAPNQALPFAQTGITLIYGDNGSGKSGYARILKKACRARLVENILGNVFAAKPSKEPARASLELLVGDQKKSVAWEDGKASSAELARIAVFDNKCAAVYVDQENQVTFIPYNLDCFERLAALCDRLKNRLGAEQRTLQLAAATPVLALPEGTASHAFLNALATKTDKEVDDATSWSKKDDARLAELNTLVTDPEKRALALRQLHAQVKSTRDAIATAAPHLADAGVKALRAKKDALKKADEAAALAAAHAFAKEPLAGTGSSPWRELYEAAREFSEKEAYGGKPFPVVTNGARCVLCQQTLQNDAMERMKRFDQFIKANVTKKADDSRKIWTDAIGQFRAAVNALAPLAEALDKILQMENLAIRNTLVTYLADGIALREQIEKYVIGEEDGALGKVPAISIADVDAYLAAIIASAVATEVATKDESGIKLRKELAELEARKQLHANKAQVVKRADDLRIIAKLETAIKACGTTGISQKGTALLKEHVTGGLEAKLLAERKALGIATIPLRLSSRTDKGSPSHQLKLDQTTFNGNTSSVLSEGEHRALALASFLAEQRTIAGKAPIIVDDPVSSLDHDRRHRVAHRLVEEAATRQVIVFTHDLLFYTDATFIAAEKQIPLNRIAIGRGPNGYGCVDPDGDPWNAKMLGKRRQWLEQQHAKLKKLHTSGNGEEFQKEASFFYGRLRETWERLIEEGLFANVVVRYRRSVETKRLSEVAIDDATFSQVYHGMTAISEYTGHDTPAAAGVAWPDPDTMKGHLDDLIACMAAVDAASKVAKKHREKLEKAPQQKAASK
ncbi:MAG: AAA family ATPase [Alphaproteobacteria bacterium]|nr:AAA family ATPase [Alphaproteobacteria bacterium]